MGKSIPVTKVCKFFRSRSFSPYEVVKPKCCVSKRRHIKKCTNWKGVSISKLAPVKFPHPFESPFNISEASMISKDAISNPVLVRDAYYPCYGLNGTLAYECGFYLDICSTNESSQDFNTEFQLRTQRMNRKTSQDYGLNMEKTTMKVSSINVSTEDSNKNEFQLRTQRLNRKTNTDYGLNMEKTTMKVSYTNVSTENPSDEFQLRTQRMNTKTIPYNTEKTTVEITKAGINTAYASTTQKIPQFNVHLI